MKNSYLNNLMSSFYLWLDHEILYHGEAYTNYSGKLFETADPNFALSSIYGSPFRQWVYDTSITGANIISGVFNNGVYEPKNNGLKIDYNRGRAIYVSKNIGKNITSSYALKEYNIYYTDEKEEKLIFENAYSVTPKINAITGSLNYLDRPFPCIFIKNTNIQNYPFSFGGQDSTESMVRCIILASNSFSLDSLLSLLNDSNKKNIPIFDSKELPFDIYGDIKSGINFNYKNYASFVSVQDYSFIKNVTVSKLSEVENSKINKKCLAALVDFELSSVRSPRK
jgi:hypothetical protein